MTQFIPDPTAPPDTSCTDTIRLFGFALPDGAMSGETTTKSVLPTAMAGYRIGRGERASAKAPRASPVIAHRCQPT